MSKPFWGHLRGRACSVSENVEHSGNLHIQIATSHVFWCFWEKVFSHYPPNPKSLNHPPFKAPKKNRSDTSHGIVRGPEVNAEDKLAMLKGEWNGEQVGQCSISQETDPDLKIGIPATDFGYTAVPISGMTLMKLES